MVNESAQTPSNEALLPAAPEEIMLESHEADGIPVEKSKKRKFFTHPWFILTMVLVLALLALGGWIGVVGYNTYTKVKIVEAEAKKTATDFSARNLGAAKTDLAATKGALADAHKTFQALSPLGYVPFIGGYVHDVNHVFNAGEKGGEVVDMVITAISPYADVMGFTGAQSSTPQMATAEDRIIFIAQTVEKISPQMDAIGGKLKEINTEIQAIDPNRYPLTVAGHQVRSNIVSLQHTVSSAADSISQFQPIVKLLPTLLGNPDPKRYLVVFQNDAELRPTGGFLTAYATLTVANGKIEPGVSQDIYTLDAAFNSKIPAPDPIKKYLPLVYNWYLRDMNLSPDFKVSMDTFTKYYGQTPGAPDFDGLIAIDTQVPVAILKVLGPIGVPGYGGKFSAENDPRCNCPQVIYELENIITRPTYEIRPGRKSILGPLMNSMLANMMGSPRSVWPQFFTIFTDSIREKHLLMYFKDPNMQNAAEVLGAAGRINDYAGDYLHINDTNFAGAKSNMFVQNTVDETVTINGDGSITKKLVMTYMNPQLPDNCNLEAGQLCLNGILRDWQRIYVPKGSVLKSAQGYEVDMTTSTDLGHTVFDGFFTLPPAPGKGQTSIKKLTVEYTVPAGHVTSSDYKLLIQKQPGTKVVKHTITVNGGDPQVYNVDSDTEVDIPR